MAELYAKIPVPGNLLTRGTNNKWIDTKIPDFYEKLNEKKPLASNGTINPSPTQTASVGPRIFCIPPSEKPKPYERLASNDDCREFLITQYKFPRLLFEKTWWEGNGFAGLRQYGADDPDSACITVSWLRVLVKIIKEPDPDPKGKDYYWHEMTFLIHDSDEGAPTIFCCDVDNRFHEKMLKELDSMSIGFDWRDVHAMLFRQLTFEIDYSVWACSNAVRELEKNRPNSGTSLQSSIDFRKMHDLLRHALHTSETLQTACLNLKDWLESYKKISEFASQIGPLIKPDEYHYDMLNSFQLIQSLLKRADSNEARLRNEINMAFNTVSQQDAKAVRIISVASLIFLPATFVSTLFSMSFFSFQPAYQDGWGVSPQIWIYFAVAVPLTMVTIVLWFKLSWILTRLHNITWNSSMRIWLKGKPKKSI